MGLWRQQTLKFSQKFLNTKSSNLDEIYSKMLKIEQNKSNVWQ